MTEKAAERRETLLEELDELNVRFLSIFPNFQDDLPFADHSPLPSNFLQEGIDISHSHLVKWIRMELDLRIGIGHDLLQDLRHAVGLYHFLVRKVKKDARGDFERSKVSKQTSSASGNRDKIISDYIKNWNAINTIVKSDIVPNAKELLRGLQELDGQKDAKFFTEWGQQTSDYNVSNTYHMTWIWKIAMSGKVSEVTNRSEPEATDHNSESNALESGEKAKNFTEEWEREGKFRTLVSQH